MEHLEVHVAVAGVAAAHHQGAGRRRDLLDPYEVLRDRRPRDHEVDDVVGVHGLRGPEGLLASVDERRAGRGGQRSEEHTSELQSLMRISYAVFCLKKKYTYKLGSSCK